MLSADRAPSLPDKRPQLCADLCEFFGGDGRDCDPLTRKRMETIDDDVAARSTDFIQRMHQAGKPFFMWVNCISCDFT